MSIETKSKQEYSYFLRIKSKNRIIKLQNYSYKHDLSSCKRFQDEYDKE